MLGDGGGPLITHRIDLVIGPPILPDGRSTTELIREAEGWIERTCQQLAICQLSVSGCSGPVAQDQ